MAWLPIAILIAVVVAWTGPWSHLPSIVLLHYVVAANSAITPGATISAMFNWTPFVGGSAILASWVVVAILLRVSMSQVKDIFAKTWSQMWGACLVGVFIFGLAYVFNYSGMAGSLANAFAKIGPAFIVVAPILGFIGVALSGSTHRPTPCSARSRRWSEKCSVSRCCCCRPSTRSAPKSASRSRRRPRASASRPRVRA